MEEGRERAHGGRISVFALLLVACHGMGLEADGSSARSENDGAAIVGAGQLMGAFDSAVPPSAVSFSGSTASGVYGAFLGAQPCTNPPVPASDAGDGGSAEMMLAPLVGTWTGTIETPNPDDLTLVFTQRSAAVVTGTLTFGTAAPPPPPTSSTESYPPDAGPGFGYAPFPYPGFPYSAVNVSFDGTRLQFGIVRSELWKGWCELQTSYSWAPNAVGCGCLPDWGGYDTPTVCELTEPDSGTRELFDCRLAVPCEWPGSSCNCTSAGCSVDMSNPTDTLDLQLAGTTLDGQITGPQNVVLHRLP